MRGDLKSFGAALRQARELKGLTQQDVVDQIPETYSDDRALRRIENGERRPKRQVIVELVVKALKETRSEKVDLLLELAGYETLSNSEIEELKLLKSKAFPGLRDFSEPELQADPPIERPSTSEATIYIGCAFAAVSVGLVTLQSFRVNPIWLSAIASVLYSSLYPASILLEASYEGWSLRTYRACIGDFCWIYLTSVASVTVDANIGTPTGFWGALFIYIAAATGQSFAVRGVLPNVPLVPSKFQTLTAQAAHMKNTLYFLLLGLAFWFLPFHAMLALRGIAGSGVPQDGDAFIPKPIWLWGFLVVIIGVSIPMGAHLLENLTSGPNLNRYHYLFYTRALLCFLLCVVCLIWYSMTFAELPGQLVK